MSTLVNRRSALARVEPAAEQTVGAWRLVRLVASGPACDVYQARPAEAPATMPARYALKLLRAEWQHRPEASALIAREAQVGRMVSHRRLVPVLAAQVEHPPYFVVTPWLEGVTLETMLRHQERLPLAIGLWIARQATEALDALHQQGWIHGDIKPGNLLISPTRHVTLLDLGFARRAEEPSSAATRFGLGTPSYLPPEAITSHHGGDIRSDLYSLGATLFHLLAGQPPFAGNSLEEIVFAHRTQTPPKLRTLVPTLPHDVAELVQNLLAKDPLRRPQAPDELLKRLVRLEIDALAARF